MSDRRRLLMSGSDLPTGVAEFTWYATKAVSNAILLKLNEIKPSSLLSSVTINGVNISIPTTQKDLTYSFPSAGYYTMRIKVKNSTSSMGVYFPKNAFLHPASNSATWALGDNSTYYCIEMNLSGLVFDYTNGIAGFLPSLGALSNSVTNRLQHIIMPKVNWTVTAKSWPPTFSNSPYLEKISNFKNIDCSGGFNTNQTGSFHNCKVLTELVVENCDFSQGGFPDFSEGGHPLLQKVEIKNCKISCSVVPAPMKKNETNPQTIELLDYSGTNFSYNTTKIGDGSSSNKAFYAKKILFNNCIFGKLTTIDFNNHSTIEELDFTNCNLSTITKFIIYNCTNLKKLVITGPLSSLDTTYTSDFWITNTPNVTLYYNDDSTYNKFKSKAPSTWKYVKI